MLKIADNAPEGDVGIIIGRFQTDKLHDGHLDLIFTVKNRHHRLIILLGLAELPCTKNNPLDFQARRQMLQEAIKAYDKENGTNEFDNIDILYVKDQHDNELWVQRLDALIDDNTKTKSAVLYGSRDSFIPVYMSFNGKYPVIELEASTNISGTEVRDRIKGSTRPTADFRAGVIWATQSQYDVCYPTVDIAILKYDEVGNPTDLLLGRKTNEKLWRFPGGFAEGNTDSFEEDAKREALEETRLEVSDVKYVGSKKINDWRYRSERSKIKTLLFKAKYTFGKEQADDDLAEVKWYPLKGFNKEILNPSHQNLWDMLEKDLGLDN